VSMPTLTWPCSMYFTASCTVSAIFNFYMITGSLRLQKVLTFAPFSTEASPYLELMTPISYSLFTNYSVLAILYSSEVFRSFNLEINFVS
jgi:hypothetical protein